MNEKWKRQAVENQNKVHELLHSVELEYVTAPEKLLDILKLGASFYQYSLNNMKLIYAQKADATYIQSFEAWKKMGASVLRGQKGIKIFVPVRTTFIILPDGTSCPLSEATAEQKELYHSGVLSARSKISYKIGNVFDISQTNFPIERRNEIFLEDVSISENQELINVSQNLMQTVSDDAKSKKDVFESICTAIILLTYLEMEIDKNVRDTFQESFHLYAEEIHRLHPESSQEETMKLMEESISVSINRFRNYINENQNDVEEATEVPAQYIAEIPHISNENISKVAQANYKAIMALAPGVLKGEVEYSQFDAGEGFDKLSIERIGPDMIAMAHNFVQNGDLMADPDMEFEVDHEKQTLNARTFQNDLVAKYTCVIREDGTVDERLEKELNSFAKTWLRNIKMQGYKLVEKSAEIEYFTLNLGGTGIGKDTEPVIYDNAESALKAYLGAEVDGKQIGIRLNGKDTIISEFNMVSFKNNYIMNPEYLPAGVSGEVSDAFKQSMQLIRDKLSADNISHSVQLDVSNIANRAAENMIRQKSEWGSWFGRIVNSNRPQDYIVVDITGYSTHHEIQYTINVVIENEVVAAIDFMLPTKKENFEISVRNANEEAHKRIYDFLNDTIPLLKAEAVFTMYYGKEQEMHYKMLKTAGYDDFPSYDKYLANKNLAEAKQYSFEVVECSEYPTLGKVYSDIANVVAALEQFAAVMEKKGNMVPGINMVISSEGSDEERSTIPLASGKNIDLTMFKHYQELKEDKAAVEQIKEFVKKAREVGFQTYGKFDFELDMQQNRRRRGR